jgi:tRNA(Ile2) C34 agmatinyltransferase TiaS
MSKLHTIQVNVPICPECGGGLKFNQIGNRYRCIHCGAVYRIVDQGQNEREFICEGEKNGQINERRKRKSLLQLSAQQEDVEKPKV